MKDCIWQFFLIFDPLSPESFLGVIHSRLVCMWIKIYLNLKTRILTFIIECTLCPERQKNLQNLDSMNQLIE
jgi:hypothetical protein